MLRFVSLALVGLVAVAAQKDDPCLDPVYTKANYVECCAAGGHAKPGHAAVCDHAKKGVKEVKDDNPSCSEEKYVKEHYVECCGGGSAKMYPGRQDACRAAKKSINDGDERCLQESYASQNYKACCAGGSYMIPGRAEVCKSVKNKVKSELR